MIKNKEAVIVFAFGCPSRIESNIILSYIALNKVKELEEKNKVAIIFTQYDVAIPEENIKVKVVRPNEIMNNPFTTYELSIKAIEWAVKNEIKKLWIVAAPCHFTRCLRDITYVTEQKKAKIKFQTCQEIYQKTYSNDWFCKGSKEWWTRSSWLWWPREIMLLLTPIYFYKKITTKNH